MSTIINTLQDLNVLVADENTAMVQEIVLATLLASNDEHLEKAFTMCKSLRDQAGQLMHTVSLKNQDIKDITEAGKARYEEAKKLVDVKSKVEMFRSLDGGEFGQRCKGFYARLQENAYRQVILKDERFTADYGDIVSSASPAVEILSVLHKAADDEHDQAKALYAQADDLAAKCGFTFGKTTKK